MCFSLLHDVFLVEPLFGMRRVKNLSAGARSLFNLPQSGLVQQVAPSDILVSVPFWVAPPFYPKLHSNHNAAELGVIGVWVYTYRNRSNWQQHVICQHFSKLFYWLSA